MGGHVDIREQRSAQLVRVGRLLEGDVENHLEKNLDPRRILEKFTDVRVVVERPKNEHVAKC